MNKEILSSRMGMEDPEAAADEYKEKVAQSNNPTPQGGQRTGTGTGTGTISPKR